MFSQIYARDANLIIEMRNILPRLLAAYTERGKEIERLREALETVKYKAGSHTVAHQQAALGAADPGYAGIYAVARAALAQEPKP